jgi:hypothetical protein
VLRCWGPRRSPAPDPGRVGNRTKLTKADGETTVVYGYTYNGLGQLGTEYTWTYSWDTQDRRGNWRTTGLAMAAYE